MIVGLLSVACAAAIGTTCVFFSWRARAAIQRLAPPPAKVLLERARELAGATQASHALLEAELNAERRDALRSMSLLGLRPRAAARVALASGTACSLLALADGLTGELQRALLLAVICFGTGSVASFAAAQLGRLASSQQQQFRDEWNRRCGEASQLLQVGTAPATAELRELLR